jgi:hypothetical protein
MDVREIVSAELEAMGAGREILSLWSEIAAAYEQSGPDGVRDLLTEKVKAMKKSAAREAKEISEAAGVVSKSVRGKR